MFIFDALDGRCRVIKLRARVKSCKVCGDLPTITSLAASAAEVGATCLDATYPTDVEAGVTSVSAKDYLKVMTAGKRYVRCQCCVPLPPPRELHTSHCAATCFSTSAARCSLASASYQAP